MALGDTWHCPSCHRKVLLDRHGALREHTMIEGADAVWACVGTGFNIFRDARRQLIERGLLRPAANEGKRGRR